VVIIDAAITGIIPAIAVIITPIPDLIITHDLYHNR